MLASGLLGISCLVGSCTGFCEHAVCLVCHSCLLSAIAPSPSSLPLVMVSIWGGKYLRVA